MISIDKLILWNRILIGYVTIKRNIPRSIITKMIMIFYIISSKELIIPQHNFFIKIAIQITRIYSITLTITNLYIYLGGVFNKWIITMIIMNFMI
jgi:hypothetical protein